MGWPFLHFQLRLDIDTKQRGYNQPDYCRWSYRWSSGIQSRTENSIQECSIRSIVLGGNWCGRDGDDKVPEKTAAIDAKLDVRAIDKNEKKIVCKDASRFVQSDRRSNR